jgi:MFS family permease
VLCAAAPSAGFLIGSRALQGLLGAVMLPQVFGLIRDLFPADQMGKAWAIFGPVSGLSAVLGPVVAGLLIDLDVAGTGWRSIFLVNVPGARSSSPPARGSSPPSPRPAARGGSTSPACRWPAPAPCCSSTRWCRAASSAGRCGSSR